MVYKCFGQGIYHYDWYGNLWSMTDWGDVSVNGDEKYFFTAEDIDKSTKNKTQRYNLIKNLVKKGRIIKINRHKFYLIPIKAKSGSWSEHPFVLADEIFDGKDYVIGGWSAANY